MNSTRVLSGVLTVLLLLSGCLGQSYSSDTVLADASSAKILPGSLVETGELASLLGKPNVVIVDTRAEDRYQQFHIPGAVNIPKALFRKPEDIAYKKENGFAIASEKAEKVFGEAGIDANTRVVLYDSVTFPDASVVWALLKYYGHDNVQVLRGGYEKWASEGRQLTAKQSRIEKRTFKVNPRPEMVATDDYILKNRENIVVLDMRTFEEYLGINPAGNPRGGHVPDAVHIEWVELADASTVKSPDEMQRVLYEAGVTRDKEIVTYCNWGIGRATLGFMVLKMLGYEKVRIYGGSMEDWSSNAELQVHDVSNVPTTIT